MPGIFESQTDEISEGSGNFINYSAARRNAVVQRSSGGDIVLNFEQTDIREVTNTILGDMLGANYVVDPGVTGTVTLATSQPLSSRRSHADPRSTAASQRRCNYLGRRYLFRRAECQGIAEDLTAPQVRLSGERGFQLLLVPLRFHRGDRNAVHSAAAAAGERHRQCRHDPQPPDDRWHFVGTGAGEGDNRGFRRPPDARASPSACSACKTQRQQPSAKNCRRSWARMRMGRWPRWCAS